MKKRLLIMFAAALGAVNSFAYEVGQFVYTANGRFQITGPNLVTNGDFSKGFEGWTNFGGTALSTDTFEVANDGPNGLKCLTATSTSGGAQKTDGFATSTNFMQTVKLEQNTRYIVTYKTRAYTLPRITSVSLDRNNNYQNVFVNGDGTWPVTRTTEDRAKIQQSLYSFGTCSNEWQERSVDYQSPDSTTYLTIFFFNLVPGDSYADFGIYEVRQLGDDRKVQDAINMIEFCANDKVNFPNGGEELEGVLEDLRNAIGSEQTVNDMEDLIYNTTEAEESPFKEFLANNSADVSVYYKNFTFNDVASTGANKGVAAGWTSSTGTDRWGVGAPTLNLTTNHLFGEIAANYALSASTAYQGVSLPKGKYLYIVRGVGFKYFQDGSGKSSNYYHKDSYSPVEGMKFFMNNDTIDMENVGNDYANLYMHVFDVQEDGVQTIGFVRPATTACATGSIEGHSGGGRISFDNVELRAIGKTDADILAYYYEGTLNISRENLQASIDASKAAIADEQYLFDTSILNDSIAAAEKTLTETTEPSQENIDIVNAQKSNLDKALRAYKNINAEYTLLYKDIKTCKTALADENRPNGKDVFGAAIKVAEDYIGAQTETTRDSSAIMATDKTLMEAHYAYGMANASIAAPVDILVNGTFANNNGTGWTIDGVTGNGVWKYQSNSDFTDGHCVYYNRGQTAKDSKYIYQDVVLPVNGVYEYSAEIICRNYTMGDAETDFMQTDMFFFAGTDSTEVYTNWDATKTHTSNPGQDYPGNVKAFSKILKVEDINAYEDATIRVGLTCKNENQTVYPNLIYFGSAHFNYLGSIESYETGIVNVNANAQNNGDVYSINGVKVRANANSLKGLEKGLYIMNGKKYVVK